MKLFNLSHAEHSASLSSRRYHEDKASTSKPPSNRSRSKVDEESSSAVGSYAPTAEAGVSGVFEEEPTLNQGVFSALLLAHKKGYVEEPKEKEVSGSYPNFHLSTQYTGSIPA